MDSMPESVAARDVEYIRKFSRFYAHYVGALNNEFLGADSSLPDAQVLFEIAANQPVKAADLTEIIGMDRSNLSRIINKFEKVNKWVKRDSAESDGRVKQISLTPHGQASYIVQNQRLNEAVEKQLSRLKTLETRDLVQALSFARILLDGNDLRNSQNKYIIREFTIGDISLLASRQIKMYKEEQKWGYQLEVVISEIASQFLKNFKQGKEQCFIAELEGCFAGGILLAQETEKIGRMRLFHVETFARHKGIGDALIKKCIEFARVNNYSRIILWTHKVLEAALRLYLKNGFEIYEEFSHNHFGRPVPSQMLKLDL